MQGGDNVTLKGIYNEIVKIKTDLKNIVEASETRVVFKIESLNNKSNNLEKENLALKDKIESLERQNRKTIL